MEETKIMDLKALLFDSTNGEIKTIISQIEDQEFLYVYMYNYNWDNGFEIPQAVLDNDNCDLSIALLIFYRADGLRYLVDKSDNVNLPQWQSFIKKLYDAILSGRYQRGKIAFKVQLSKVQLYKLSKGLKEQEKIFIENIEGKCVDIDL